MVYANQSVQSFAQGGASPRHIWLWAVLEVFRTPPTKCRNLLEGLWDSAYSRVTTKLCYSDVVRYMAVSQRRGGGLERPRCRILRALSLHGAHAELTPAAMTRQQPLGSPCPGKPTDISAPKGLTAGHVGTLCPARAEVSGSRKESRCSALPYCCASSLGTVSHPYQLTVQGQVPISSMPLKG